MNCLAGEDKIFQVSDVMTKPCTQGIGTRSLQCMVYMPTIRHTSWFYILMCVPMCTSFLLPLAADISTKWSRLSDFSAVDGGRRQAGDIQIGYVDAEGQVSDEPIVIPSSNIPLAISHRKRPPRSLPPRPLHEIHISWHASFPLLFLPSRLHEIHNSGRSADRV
jgi:hypothetical protein